MNFNMTELIPLLPEIFLLSMLSMILIVDTMLKDSQRTLTYVLTLATLAGCAWLTFSGHQVDPVHAFSGMFVSDAISDVLKLALYLAVAFMLVYSRGYLQARGLFRGEFYVLTLFATLGMMVMISASHFLTLYLGLELLSLSLYAMVALQRDSAVATEAAMKYFVLGAIASGMLLYGMSMVYGSTGSLMLTDVSVALQEGTGQKVPLVFGLVFIVAGLAFKMGAAPFHMWIPDVYQGAPTAVTIMIGSAPELAAFAIAIRLLVEGLLPLAIDWQQMLAILAIGSLLIGNLAAIAQTNLKRMLAYSTIAQMGFVLLGLMSGVVDGKASAASLTTAYSAAMFYIVTYVLTTLASFGVILLLAREGFESEEIADLAGLNQRSPLYAGVMAVCLFSLAGIPPLVGFYAKLTVLEALIGTGQEPYIWLAVFAVIMSLVGAFYYLRVVKVMYFDAPITATTVSAPAEVRVVLTLNGALVLILGIMPGGLMTLCAQAIVKTLGS